MSNRLDPDRYQLKLEAFVADYRRSPYAIGEDGEPLAIVPSPLDEEMLRDHESLLGVTLPPILRAYLQSWCLPTADLYVGQLPRVQPDRPFESVERWSIEKMDQPFYRRNERLIPFTQGPADCSDLCCDILRPDRSGDFPIIKVWHDRMDGEPKIWTDLDCERAQVFESFSGYFDYLQNWLIYRTAPRDSIFEDWLQAGGRAVPRSDYGEPW